MGTVNVQHNAVEKQCFFTAYRLINRVREPKSISRASKDPASDPRIQGRLNHKDAREGTS